MKDLKETLQSDLNYINSIINEGYGDTNIISQNIMFLLTIADELNIKLKEPKSISKYILEDETVDDLSTKEYIDNYHRYKAFNVALTNIGSKINDEYSFKLVDPRYKARIELEDSIKIVGDFFKQYDKDVYDFYENFIVNGKFFVVKRLLENYGLSAVADDLLDPYLLLKSTRSIRDITVLAHELMHIYIYDKRKDLSEEEESNIFVNGTNEVYSHYMEYIILDYLSSIGFNKRDIINYKKSLYTELIEHLDVLYTLLEPTDIDFESYNEVVLFDDMKKYSYGLYFIYPFYDQYIKDKDMAKENITNFMLDSRYKEFESLINNYGLDEENLKDHKVLLKHVQDLY